MSWKLLIASRRAAKSFVYLICRKDMCVFKDIFGKPNQGVHSYRLFGLAIFDALATIVLAFVITYVFKINICISLVAMVLLGIIVHRCLCVNTALNIKIFGEV